MHINNLIYIIKINKIEKIKFLEKQSDACRESKQTQFYWNPCDKAQQLQLSHNNLVVKHTGKILYIYIYIVIFIYIYINLII